MILVPCSGQNTQPVRALLAKTNDYKSLLRLWPQRRGTTISGHSAGEPLTVATTQGNYCQWPQRRGTTVSGHNAGEPLTVATTQGNHCQWPQHRGTTVSGHTQGNYCQWPQRRGTTVSGHNAGELLSVATTQGNHCQWPQRRGTTVSGHNAGEPCTQRHSTGLTSDVVKPWLPLLLVLGLIHIAHQLGPIGQAGRKVAIPFRFWIPVVEISWGARHQFVVLPPAASRRL